MVSHVDRIGQMIKTVWTSCAASCGLPLKVNGHNAICGFTLEHSRAAALETLPELAQPRSEAGGGRAVAQQRGDELTGEQLTGPGAGHPPKLASYTAVTAGRRKRSRGSSAMAVISTMRSGS